MNLNREQILYLAREAVLFLLLNYLILEGGVSNGLVSFRLNQASFWLVAIIMAVWLGWRLWRRRPFPATPLDLAWLGLLASYLVSTIFSVDPRRSAIVLSQFILAGLAFYFFVELLRAGWSDELLTKVILLTSLLPIALSLLQLGVWYAGWIRTAGWSHPIPPVAYRVSAFIANPNYSAAYFNLLIPLGLARVIEARTRGTRIGWLVWMALAMGLVFLTLSRGGWLGTLAALTTFAMLYALDHRGRLRAWWQRSSRRGLYVGLSGMAVLSVAAVTGLFFAWQARSTGSAGSGLNVSARSGIWSVAWDMFRAHPLTGNGPFTFGTEYVRHYSVPPSMLLAYAHNHLFNVMAENGLFGLAALFGMVAAIGILVVRRWRVTSGSQRLAITAVTASLAGLAVHSQFDTPALLPAIGVLAMGLLALLAREVVPERKRGQKAMATAVLIGTSLALVAAMGYNVWAYAPAAQGVAASEHGDWRLAAAQFDLAARRDPRLAFNWFQAGFAHGMMALDANGSAADRTELGMAVEDYRRGLRLEPNYAVNWANYAVLVWAQGDWETALTAMGRAGQVAYHQPIFRLTLGKMQEQLGRTDEARATYLELLKEVPDWGDAAFFQATDFRREVAAQARKASNSPAGDPWPEYSEAELRQMIFAYPGGWVEMKAQAALGALYARRGDDQAAQTAYARARELAGETTSFGVGTLGGSPYGWSVWNRESIAQDLLPGVEVAPDVSELASSS